jgi:hypothetical protein
MRYILKRLWPIAFHPNGGRSLLLCRTTTHFSLITADTRVQWSTYDNERYLSQGKDGENNKQQPILHHCRGVVASCGFDWEEVAGALIL